MTERARFLDTFVFEKYDFEENARELGMMMTILENHDENIKLQKIFDDKRC